MVCLHNFMNLFSETATAASLLRPLIISMHLFMYVVPLVHPSMPFCIVSEDR
eukprot:COSAG02_NODE_64974_length_259_cov_0.643750_1_plen_51_part_01